MAAKFPSPAWVKEKNLGAGSFGEVTLFKKVSDDNKVQRLAVKVCKPGNHRNALEKWREEIDIMRRISDRAPIRSIVKAFNPPDDIQRLYGNKPILVMEYCDGGDLRQELHQSHCGFSEYTVRTIMGDISRGLEHLHLREGIAHRDLKPENIVIANQGSRKVYKITDLGLAKSVVENSVLQSMVGTQAYWAPEMYREAGRTVQYDRAVDIWSLGIILHECITGFRSFYHGDEFANLHKLCQKKDGIVSIYITEENKYKENDSLVLPNRLCRTTKVSFERVLRMMLYTNPSMRGISKGKGDVKKRDKWWIMLHRHILEVSVVFVHLEPANLLLSYVMDPTFTVANLHVAVLRSALKLVSQDRQGVYANKTPRNCDMLTLFPDGSVASSDANLSTCVEKDKDKDEEKFDSPSFYVYITTDSVWNDEIGFSAVTTNPSDTQVDDPDLPEALNVLLNSKKDMAKTSQLLHKRVSHQLIYYCELKIKSVKQKVDALDCLWKSVSSKIRPCTVEEHETLSSLIDYEIESCKQDIESLEKRVRSEETKEVLNKWEKELKKLELSKNYLALFETSNTTTTTSNEDALAIQNSIKEESKPCEKMAAIKQSWITNHSNRWYAFNENERRKELESIKHQVKDLLDSYNTKCKTLNEIMQRLLKFRKGLDCPDGYRNVKDLKSSRKQRMEFLLDVMQRPIRHVPNDSTSNIAESRPVAEQGHQMRSALPSPSTMPPQSEVTEPQLATADQETTYPDTDL